MKPDTSLSDTHPANEGGGLSGMVRSWDRFWFSRADPLPLGVIRIFAGVVILYVHLIYSLDLMAMVGPHGWLDHERMDYLRKEMPYNDMPRNWNQSIGPEYAQGMAIWSVYFHLKDPAWIIATHVAFLVVMFLFTIGFATRLTAVLTWFGIMCYIQRLPVFMYGMDTIMNIVVIYLMIAPSGATLSVDRLIAKWWARKKGLEPPTVQPSVSANFALRMMQIHFCIIYLASGLSKLQGPAWWNGTALWGTMANYSFAPMNFPVYVNFLEYLCRHRWLWEIIMTTGSYFTLFLEISFPFMVWRPKLRWLWLCFSVMLHTGIGLIMGLSTFSLLMLCLVMAFIPAATHHAFINILQRKLEGMWESVRGKGRPASTATQQPALAAGA